MCFRSGGAICLLTHSTYFGEGETFWKQADRGIHEGGVVGAARQAAEKMLAKQAAASTLNASS